MVDKNARLEYLDLFRGFGIIFMVMGHIGFGKMFDFWIHAFHMPMFFFVSGLGQFTRNYTQTTKRGLLTTNKG